VDLIVRAAVMFLFLWVVLRAMGKRELSQLNAFELVLLIVMGDLVQQAVTLEDHSMVGAFMIISTIALLTVGASWLTFRSDRFARAFEGVPTPVWREGGPVRETMRRERVRLDEIEAEARKQGISKLADVYVATLEKDGTISFLRIEDDDEPPAGNSQRSVV